MLADLIRRAPTIASSDAQLLLRETYDKSYGIFNHDAVSEARPYSIVAMHWAEDTTSTSPLHACFEEFARKEVPKYFQLSLTEFLKLPREACKRILEVCDKLRKEEETRTNKSLNNLGLPKDK